MKTGVTGLGVALTLAASSLQGVAAPPLSPRDIVERCGKAVVLIDARTRDGTSQGSGFLVGQKGRVVTSLHVIERALDITVSLHDGTRLASVEIGAFDVEKDLAVLVVALPREIAAPPSVEVGDTAAIAPGAPIVVIGNPLGLEHTVTEGIVSAWRDLSARIADQPGARELPDVVLPRGRLLQISAPISPGSSGGPVFNEGGQVIGVATAGVASGTADLNFAVPIDNLPALLAQDEALDLATFAERLDDVRGEMALPYIDEGRAAYDRGDIGEADTRIEQALRLFPRSADALLLSGWIAVDTDRLEQAQKRFDQALQVDAYNAEAWYGLGRVHRLQALRSGDAARVDQAEAAFDQALACDPRHARALFELALIKLAQGLVARAEELLASAVENEPDFADAHYTLGEIDLRLGRLGQAREAFEQALRADEGHALSHFGLARLYMKWEGTIDGTVAPHGRASHHWEEFLRLSEDDPSLAQERHVAMYYVEQYFPYLLDR